MERLLWVQEGGTKEELRAPVTSNPERKPEGEADGVTALNRIFSFLRRFVFLSRAQLLVVVLWIAHTHVVDAADVTPYLAITSPEKRSGKTRLLEALAVLVANPWMTGRVTAAVLIRKIDKEHPTLLLDESDAAFGGDKEYAEVLRGVLNSGHRREGRASCCVGQGANMSYQDFSTFSPKAIAGIGKLPDTVADRAVPIRLKRKSPSERVERFRLREVEGEAAALREMLAAWCERIVDNLRDARPDLPSELTDRQQDGAEPLLVIADAAGGEWPEAARQALIEVCTSAQASDESVSVMLLRDIRAIFEDRKVDRLSSASLVSALTEIETSPWVEWKNGKPLTARGLAKLLRPFEIDPNSVRLGDKTPKGYLRSDFEDAFQRYLSATSATVNNSTDLGGIAKRNAVDPVADKECDKPSEISHVADVAGVHPSGVSAARTVEEDL
jgi:hypothetical protein